MQRIPAVIIPVPGILFEPNHQSEVLPGNVAFYAHTFTSEADGGVRFNGTGSGSTASGWSHVLYRDSNCNGTLDGAEADTAITNMNFGISAGGRLCIINKVYAPADAPARDQYRVDTIASFTHAGGAIPVTELRVTDLTITGQTNGPETPVNEASSLVLKKSVQNLTAGSAETETLNQATPGDVLKYRIHYRNVGTGPITDLKVNDTLPPYTGLVLGSPACESTPTGLSCTPPGNVEHLEWAFSGTLQGGASGTVSYEVVIDQ